MAEIFNDASTVKFIDFSEMPIEVNYIGTILPQITSDPINQTYNSVLKLLSAASSTNGISLTYYIGPESVKTISFYAATSSQNTYDKLVFSINGTQKMTMSGIKSSWTKYTYNLDVGINTFTWVYTKNASTNSGLDAAFITNIEINGINKAVSHTILKSTGGEVINEWYKAISQSIILHKNGEIFNEIYNANSVDLYEDFSDGTMDFLQSSFGGDIINSWEYPIGFTHSLLFRLKSPYDWYYHDVFLSKEIYFDNNANISFWFYIDSKNSPQEQNIFICSLDDSSSPYLYEFNSYTTVDQWRYVKLSIPTGLHTIKFIFETYSTSIGVCYITGINFHNVNNINHYNNIKIINTLSDEIVYNSLTNKIIDLVNPDVEFETIGTIAPILIEDPLSNNLIKDNVFQLNSMPMSYNGFSFTYFANTSDTKISFSEFTSSESGYDRLIFSINNQDLLDTSGEQSVWTQHTYNLSQGSNSLKWKYYKDSSVNSGLDAVFIKNILINNINPIIHNNVIYTKINELINEYIPYNKDLFTEYFINDSLPNYLKYDDINNYQIIKFDDINCLSIKNRVFGYSYIEFSLPIYSSTSGSISYKIFIKDIEEYLRQEFLINGTIVGTDISNTDGKYILGTFNFSSGLNIFTWRIHNTDQYGTRSLMEYYLQYIKIIGDFELGYGQQEIKIKNNIYDKYIPYNVTNIMSEDNIDNFINLINKDNNLFILLGNTDLPGYQYKIQFPNRKEELWQDDVYYCPLNLNIYLKEKGFLSFYIKNTYENDTTLFYTIIINGQYQMVLNEDSYDWQYIYLELPAGLNNIEFPFRAYSSYNSEGYIYPTLKEQFYLAGFEIGNISEETFYQHSLSKLEMVEDFKPVVYLQDSSVPHGILYERSKSGICIQVNKVNNDLSVEYYIPKDCLYLNYTNGVPGIFLLDQPNGYTIESNTNNSFPFGNCFRARSATFNTTVTFSLNINNEITSNITFYWALNGYSDYRSYFYLNDQYITFNGPNSITTYRKFTMDIPPGNNTLKWTYVTKNTLGYENTLFLSPVVITNVDGSINYNTIRSINSISEEYFIGHESEIISVFSGELLHEYFIGHETEIIKVINRIKTQDLHAIINTNTMKFISFNPMETKEAITNAPIEYINNFQVWKDMSYNNDGNISIAIGKDGNVIAILNNAENVKEGSANLTTLINTEDSITNWEPLNIPNIRFATVYNVGSDVFLTVQIMGVYGVRDAETSLYYSPSGLGKDWVLYSKISTLDNYWFDPDNQDGLFIWHFGSINNDGTGCITVLNNGRWVMPCGIYRCDHWSGNAYTLFQRYSMYTSDDQGHTWDYRGYMHAYMVVGDYYEQQCPKHITQTTDNHLYVAVSANQGGIDLKVYSSNDRGNTWYLHTEIDTEALPPSNIYWNNFDIISNGKGGYYLSSMMDFRGAIIECEDPINAPTTFRAVFSFPYTSNIAGLWGATTNMFALNDKIIVIVGTYFIIFKPGFDFYVITDEGLKKVLKIYMIVDVNGTKTLQEVNQAYMLTNNGIM